MRVLISGTALKLEQLPLNEFIEYKIENKIPNLSILLKTVCKSDRVEDIYLNDDLLGKLDNLDLVGVNKKTIIFKTDKELLELLSSVSVSDSEDDLDNSNVELEEGIEFTNNNDNISSNIVEEVSTDNIENVSFDELDGFYIPLADDVDNLTLKLEAKNAIIQQKDYLIEDLKQNIEDLYLVQEKNLMEMKEMYEQKIIEFNSIISDLAQKVKDKDNPFLKYELYAKNYRAVVKDSIEIGSDTTNIGVYVTGAGDSYYSLAKALRKRVEDNESLIIVDFSNDVYLSKAFNVNHKNTSLQLNDNSIDIKNLLFNVNNSIYIQSLVYNDIALLTLDWVYIINRLINLSEGNKKVILLFSGLNSFSVKYCVSKLSSKLNCLVFVKSNPVILNNLLAELIFIPDNRINVVVTEYIEVVKPLLENLSKKYKVNAFQEVINWNKLK
jgi:hypothetical protein